MWSFLGRQFLKGVGRKAGGQFFNDELNGPEVYADRIKRDFHLDDYADAWALYDSDRAYWHRYYGPLPSGLSGKEAFVRDSAAAAGVPSRRNVFEYGFPEAASAPRSTTQGELKGAGYQPVVFGAGAPPAPFAFPALQSAPRGLPGMIAEAGTGDPANPDRQPAGGLTGWIQELLHHKALRNN